MSDTAAYRAYLLRLWRENDAAPWRAMLEASPGGERHGFADLESLFDFLQAEMAAAGDRPPAASPSPEKEKRQ